MGEALAVVGGFILDAAVVVGNAVEAVAILIWEAVAAAVEAAISAIVAAAEAVTAAVEWATSQLGITLEEVADFFESTYLEYVDPIVTPITDFVSGIADPIIKFAEFIHLREIILIHNILWQVWPAYRAALAKYFHALGDLVSRFLVNGTMVIQYLAFAQASFMLLGAIAGNDYFTTQARWLKTVKETAFRNKETIEHFIDHPEELPAWFDEHVLAPMVNKTAENQNKLYENLLQLNKKATEFNERIADIDSALQNWIESAPDEWRQDIRKSVGPVAEELHDFRVNDFAPWKAKLDIIVGELREDRDRIVSQLDKPGLLFEKTLRPGAPERDRQLDTMDATLSAALARTRRRINERRAR